MQEYDCIVVGAGPAGLAAAIEAGKHGVKVLVVDENHRPGGQLFKQIHKFFGSKEHFAGTRGYKIGQALLAEAERLGVEVSLNTRAWGLFNNELAIIKDGESQLLKANKIIIATGGSENALAFSGCTLPGVITAGAAQTMVNINFVLPGKKVLMVGTGNVGLIASYQLMQAGADIVGIIDVSSSVGGYDVHARKLRRAGVPFYLGFTLLKAEGCNGVKSATICRVDNAFKPIPDEQISIEADTICLAVGLTPRLELLHMTDAKFIYSGSLGGHVPVHNENMETCKDIYVAGDIAGVEEASTAMEEGFLAGLNVAYALNKLDNDEYSRIRDEIDKRLQNLRSGCFGEIRAISKRKILEEAKRYAETHN